MCHWDQPVFFAAYYHINKPQSAQSGALHICLWVEELNTSNPGGKSLRKIWQSRKFSCPLTRQFVQQELSPQMQLSMGILCECQYPTQHRLHQGGVKDDHSWSTFCRLRLPLEDGPEDSSRYRGSRHIS